jgi:hypothetical protein
MMMATVDSEIYRKTFWGILNKQGDFWTPLAFETEAAATAKLDKFWADGWNSCDFKIVPVRIRLEAISPKESQ